MRPELTDNQTSRISFFLSCALFIDMAMRDLFEVCRAQKWMHCKTFTMPFGKKKSELFLEAFDHPLAVSHAMAVVQLAVQPIVLEKWPPLIRLFLYGCGCIRCETKRSDLDEFCERPVTAQDAMVMYLMMLQTNLFARNWQSLPACASTNGVKLVHKSLSDVQREMLYAHAVGGCAHDDVAPLAGMPAMWSALDAVMRTNSTTSQTTDMPQVLLDLALKFTTAAAARYTLRLLNALETLLWAHILSHAPSDRREELATTTLYMTRDTLFCPVGALPDADKIVREYSIKQQSDGLRMAACDSPDGATFVHWPTVHLPNHELICQQQQSPDSAARRMVPLSSAIYTVLQFYFCGLLLNAPNIGATNLVDRPARDSSRAGEPSMEQMLSELSVSDPELLAKLSDGEDTDVEIVLPELDPITGAADSGQDVVEAAVEDERHGQ